MDLALNILRSMHRRMLTSVLLLGAVLLAAVAAAMDDGADSAADAAESALVPAAPLPLGQLGDLPWGMPPLLLLVPALLLPALVWLGLAWRDAYATEPMRLRRQGVRELQRLRDQLQQAVPTPAQLRRCQRAIAAAWDVRSAAPTPDEIAAAVMTIHGNETEADRWRVLWQESERALYAADAWLAANWSGDFAVAVTTLAMPERQQPYPSQRRHWLPQAVALAMVAVVLTPIMGQASDAPITDTARWQQALALDARDWAAHRNLARQQLAEQGPLNAAAAHALASFLLHADADARAVLDEALLQAGVGEPLLQTLFVEPQLKGLPAMQAPSGWEQFAVLAAAVLVVGLSLCLAGLYRRHRWRWISGGVVVAMVGLGALIAAQLGWSAYGDLRHADVAMLLQPANLYPEPTDLVPQEETAPLPAGAVVRIRHGFLGWLQVQHAGQAPGWVRRNAVMPLYAPPAQT